MDIDNNYDFPFKKQPKNKQAFKDILYEAIVEAAQRLNVGEKTDLQPKINERLPFELPHIMFFDLYKGNNKGNVLLLELLIGGSAFILENFEQMVSHANEQLKKAHVKETFLILIEEGYNPKDPPEITDAFTNINPKSYSEIRHVYFIRGEKIAEISLPTH